MNKKKVFIGTVSALRDNKYIEDMIKSLRKQKYIDTYISVVYNGVEAKGYGEDLNFVLCKNMGVPTAWNLLINSYLSMRDEEKFDAFIIANDDIIVPDTTVYSMLKVLEKDGKSIIAPDITTDIDYFRKNEINNISKIYYYSNIHIHFGFTLISDYAIDKIGSFDCLKNFCGGEDSDYKERCMSYTLGTNDYINFVTIKNIIIHHYL